MYYTDDPVADYDRWQEEEQKWLDKRPKCSECGEPIADDYCYEFDGKLICEICLLDAHKVDTEDYVE